jgi:hypothetical protein
MSCCGKTKEEYGGRREICSYGKDGLPSSWRFVNGKTTNTNT